MTEDALLKWAGLSWIKRKAVDAFQSVLSFFQLKSGLRKRDGKSLTSGFLICILLSMQRKSSESVLIDLARQSLVERLQAGTRRIRNFRWTMKPWVAFSSPSNAMGCFADVGVVSKGPTLSGKPFGRFHAAAPSTIRVLIQWSRKKWKVS